MKPLESVSSFPGGFCSGRAARVLAPAILGIAELVSAGCAGQTIHPVTTVEVNPEHKSIGEMTQEQVIASMTAEGLGQVTVREEIIEEQSRKYYAFKYKGLDAGLVIIDQGYVWFNVNDSGNNSWITTSSHALGRYMFFQTDMDKIIGTVKRKLDQYKDSK